MKKVLLIMLALIMIVGLFGCGSNQDSQSNDTSETSDLEETGQDSSADDKILIGYVLMGKTTEFLVAEEWGAMEEAKAYDDVDVVVIDGEMSNEKQVSAVENLIAMGADAIVLNPVDAEGIAAGVKMCNDANIPVVDVDAKASGGKVDVHVGLDNKEAGRRDAEFLGEKLGGNGKILEIQGPIGAFHAEDRNAGFMEVMQEKYPNIEIISKATEKWGTDEGQQITTDVLTANPDITAIYSHSDNMVIGAIPALQQLDRLKKVDEEGHVYIASVDGAPGGLKAVLDGYCDITYAQDPIWMAQNAIRAAIKLAKGEEVEPVLEMEPIKITAENAGDPENWGNKFSAEK